ncbi:MAG: isocitrate/isopropylmalate family dehydrogenase, partial [Desulfobacterales bacterium]
MKKNYEIAVIPGDGTGPEVVAEGLKALDAAAAKYNFTCHVTTYDIGGAHYL